jgi:hypothetical protein
MRGRAVAACGVPCSVWYLRHRFRLVRTSVQLFCLVERLVVDKWLAWGHDVWGRLPCGTDGMLRVALVKALGLGGFRG